MEAALQRLWPPLAEWQQSCNYSFFFLRDPVREAPQFLRDLEVYNTLESAAEVLFELLPSPRGTIRRWLLMLVLNKTGLNWEGNTDTGRSFQKRAVLQRNES